jgi:hypothetical protein
MRRASLLIRSIYALCLLGAAANHARILARHGLFWDYGGVGTASAAYWTSLTLLDPIAALLLFVRPRAGIAATLVLIGTNVVHNLAVAGRAGPLDGPDGGVSPLVLSQIGFLLFVAATARIAWRGAPPTADADPGRRSVEPGRLTR